MPKSKLPTSLLDIFILFLVRDGINTLYRLKKEAGISIGAASPSLRRLLEREMISRNMKFRSRKEVIGERGERSYMIPLFTEQFFKPNVLKPFEESLPVDTESVARLVALAEVSDKPGVARKVLRNAISNRRERARQSAPVTERSSIAARYRSIVQACDAARLKAEAAALGKILADLKKS